MLKLHKLFNTENENDVLSVCLEPTEQQRNYLASCKNDIRDHLRPLIREATVQELGMDHPVEPRFRTQGSWSYKTCIQPAYHPPQEMDWDYGVYLPVSVWEDNGPPHKMAKAYFTLVERLLGDLCTKKKWKLIPGKDTCIRVQVAVWAHIDLPLYAAPQDKFSQIMEKLAASFSATRSSSAHDSVYLSESLAFGELTEQSWEEIDGVVMATRSGEWKPSDPYAVERWFNEMVLEHGIQLRRVCCYLKAWRDYHWKDGGGPTSIALMICAAQGFETQRGRDDLALENTAHRLATAVRGELRVKAIDEGKEDFNRLTNAEQKIASLKAAQLRTALHGARHYHVGQKDQAIADARLHLGDRVPNRLDLVNVDSGADEIRETAPQRVVLPVVPVTQAG